MNSSFFISSFLGRDLGTEQETDPTMYVMILVKELIFVRIFCYLSLLRAGGRTLWYIVLTRRPEHPNT